MSARWDYCPLFWMRSAGFPFAKLDLLRVPRATQAVDAALAFDEPSQKQAEAQAWDHAEALLAEELEAARLALRELLRDERVREALFLSSPTFFRNIGQYAEEPMKPRKSRPRQKEKTATRYLQRFFAKNETISFYGPLVWGRVDPDCEDSIAFSAGEDSLLATRQVSFEHWAVHRLAQTIAKDDDVARQLKPRLSPTCYLDGNTLFYPVARQAELDPRRSAVIEYCNEQRSWSELLEDLRDHPAFADDGPPPEEVAEELRKQRIILRELAIPTVVVNPERVLLERVRELDEPARSRWEAPVHELCEFARRFAAADLTERIAILDELGRAFTSLTGAASTRRAGEIYAARSLLYEDCERDVRDLRLGKPVAERLRALSPLLEIARWQTIELSQRYQWRFMEVFDRLRAGRPAVDFVQFVRETQWIAENDQLESDMRDEVANAWREVLGSRWTGDVECLDISSQDCREVLARLAELRRGAGTQEILGADFLSPDFLIAVPNAESSHDDAADARKLLIVMGELHKAVFLAAQPVAMPFCPDRDELLSYVQKVASGPVLSVVDSPKSYQRSNANWPDLPEFYEVLTEGATSRFPQERVIPVSTLQVVEQGGELFVVNRDGSLRVWLFSVLSGFLHHKLLSLDPVELSGAHGPRIMLDDIVVRRRRWRIDTAELQACRAAPNSAARLGAARRLQKRLGFPERVFVKSPNEPKPVYIDFSSFFLVELLFKLADEAPRLTVSEMLPGPEELWLSDAEGQRYTSEFRMSWFRATDIP
ncbi:lantibiotic dehydratase [Haliangium ochraceum]|uniref:Lantibiotic dehydratase domain protein n=1 Tax=Haliangium ochraceum (strain DSM 14365 / JCM 11303 / SMP-2) TaxID=502025 RepID=D0LMD4_HALO1|nr:lantibiotic dehydratase [Haliangium ochraceum]ACY16840.1 Lantibiotic dehydratase domain protein [Haliangium ochraceum DSM 14365]